MAAPAAMHFHNVDHFSFGPQFYVNRLQGLSDYHMGLDYLIEFDSPLASSATGIATGLATGSTTTIFTDTAGFVGGVIDGRWGREVVIVGSAAGTNNVTVNGYDHLNQPVQKVKALNGATPVGLGVALKRITSVIIAAGGAITVNVGYTNNLGLPYRTAKVMEEFVDGALQAAPGTLVAPVMTDPATNATGDPKGLYTPAVAPDGAKRFEIRALLNPWINANGNGGLHGIRHFGG